MKDDSLSEWKEGGTAALTEGVGYRVPNECQPSGMARRTAADGPPSARAAYGPGEPAAATLLDFDLGALLLEGSLDLLGLVLGDAFLDGLGGRVDDILGFLEAEPGELADDLDDRDLVRADLGEDGGELGLLLGSLGRGGARGGRSGPCECNRGGGGDAEAVLELGLELRELEDGHLLERLEQLVGGQRGHGCVSPGSWRPVGRGRSLVVGIRLPRCRGCR